LYFWGAQLETGSVASSLITTVAATATRSNDNVAVAAGAATNAFKGAAITAVASGPANLGITNDCRIISGNNTILACLYFDFFGAAWHYNEQWNNNFENSQAITDPTTNAWAGGVTVDAAGAIIYGKGAAGTNADAVAKINDGTTFAIGGGVGGGSYLNGYISRITLWPTKMTGPALKAIVDLR
jgi:hypothetical protein